jgi:hypothetical protein
VQLAISTQIFVDSRRIDRGITTQGFILRLIGRLSQAAQYSPRGDTGLHDCNIFTFT